MTDQPEPFPALGAAAMRRDARDHIFKNADRLTRYDSTEWTLSDVEDAQEIVGFVAEFGRPTPAALLRETLALPAIAALVEAATELLQCQDGLPMMGQEASRRAEVTRAILAAIKETDHG